jgi:uncharacterized tellurite resistance protein B-like protein
MGLLSRLMGSKPTKKAGDDVLLIHGMLLMAGADGSIEASEHATIQAFCDCLPEFKGKDIGDLISQGQKLVARAGGLKESVKAVGDLSTPVLKKKLYVLAVDLAMSSGDVDEKEDALLDSYQRLLDIDDKFANDCIEVMGAKYKL